MPSQKHQERFNKYGLCISCGANKPRPGRKTCDRCLIKQKDWYEANKHTPKFRKRKVEYQKRWQQTNREKYNEVTRNYDKRLRAAVLKKYGNKCACCHESLVCFLTIDHINNDGKIDRIDKGLVGRQWLTHLIKNPKRKDIQLLCWNCQEAKRIYKKCPHKMSRKELDRICTPKPVSDPWGWRLGEKLGI